MNLMLGADEYKQWYCLYIKLITSFHKALSYDHNFSTIKCAYCQNTTFDLNLVYTTVKTENAWLINFMNSRIFDTLYLIKTLSTNKPAGFDDVRFSPLI